MNQRENDFNRLVDEKMPVGLMSFGEYCGGINVVKTALSVLLFMSWLAFIALAVLGPIYLFLLLEQVLAGKVSVLHHVAALVGYVVALLCLFGEVVVVRYVCNRYENDPNDPGFGA